jgi:hypothetical protein
MDEKVGKDGAKAAGRGGGQEQHTAYMHAFSLDFLIKATYYATSNYSVEWHMQFSVK